MSWTSDVVTGVAEMLAAAGVGVWNPTGTAYGPDDVAIVLSAVPPEPDRCITLTAYGPLANDGHGDVTLGLQVRVRGTTDPRVVLDLVDAVADVLDGLEMTAIGGVPVSQVFQRPGAAIGQDSNDRHEYSSNFYIQAQRVTALRTP